MGPVNESWSCRAMDTVSAPDTPGTEASSRSSIGLRARIVAGAPVLLEERRRHHVHTLVGALGGENRGHQEFERILEIESDLGVGIGLLERANNLAGARPLGLS